MHHSPLPEALGISAGKSLISVALGDKTPVLATSKGAGWRRDDLIDPFGELKALFKGKYYNMFRHESGGTSASLPPSSSLPGWGGKRKRVGKPSN